MRDAAEACVWLERAAQTGNMDACCNLGIVYFHDLDFTSNSNDLSRLCVAILQHTCWRQVAVQFRAMTIVHWHFISRPPRAGTRAPCSARRI